MRFHTLAMHFSEKQIQIIETAEKLFADKGFDGTSVRDIAEEAGINIAMISYYFGSKEKLLEALFSYRGEGITVKLEAMLKNKVLTPIEKIFMMIDYYIEKFYTQPGFHKILSREQVANRRTATTEIIHNFKKRNKQLIKELIQEGQRSGDFVKNVDIPMLMSTLIATVSHMVTTQHFYREIQNLQDMPDAQFQKLVKKKLNNHFQFIFKAILTNEV